MSIPREPEKALLFCGVLYSDEERFRTAVGKLIDLFGSLNFLTEPRLFVETKYYEPEMGSPIYRCYLGFEDLVDPGWLADIKLTTNNLENELAVFGNRRVNLDPGLLSEERLVLATGKNYTHRIYIGKGIYAELTLIYSRGAYRPLPWTYPDYRKRELLHLLGVVRQELIFRRTDKIPSKPYNLPDDLEGIL
ncbi:MAG TPA: DUF4416 family protein [Thermodesulforhabdus norvegica]|uniref:DUF4416 family protein n=1 Tax=Thermodesulforhabdus norvegica TaxID=39841 RepID=A0A7C1AY21_9BACT|nr:DUF4416 family protein [Deltaproteobacteria bacterium]MBW2069175.1 DUF4416 family protein [Deltaproteobacteria bacterium]HDL89896.1 DUF4416 family protein [Thermodesulforhabdus norvegica]